MLLNKKAKTREQMVINIENDTKIGLEKSGELIQAYCQVLKTFLVKPAVDLNKSLNADLYIKENI